MENFLQLMNFGVPLFSETSIYKYILIYIPYMDPMGMWKNRVLPISPFEIRSCPLR